MTLLFRDNRVFLAELLRELLANFSSEKDSLLTGLVQLKMVNPEGKTGFEDSDLAAIVDAIKRTIEEFMASGKVVENLRNNLELRVTTTVVGEGLGQLPETLNEDLVRVLEVMESDFKRGIVRIDLNGTPESYAAALNEDKTAGQTWKGENGMEAMLRTYFTENDAVKLKLAIAMPGGPCLIGIYEDGKPAIRQRSLEIVSVILSNEYAPALLPHAQAKKRISNYLENIKRYGESYITQFKCADDEETFKVVKKAGYRVGVNAADNLKKGLVAASEAVMGCNYVESPVTDYSHHRSWAIALLERPENAHDDAGKYGVYFNPELGNTEIATYVPRLLIGGAGVILWL